jgi:uncharacterized protein (DUF2267 family)
MSDTGISAFDSTIQTTSIWLNEIADRMGWLDRYRAYHALRATIQTWTPSRLPKWSSRS